MNTKNKKTSPESLEKPLDVASMIESYEEKPIAPITETPKTPEETINEKLAEDLKISYEAKGILDIT